MADTSKKVKCKYGNKCYRKDKAHKNAYLHPDPKDETSEDSDTSPSRGGKLDLSGKKIVFTGALVSCTRKQAEAKAKEYGCIPMTTVSKHTDLVISASGAGHKADKAEDLKIRVMSEDDWNDLLKGAMLVSKTKAALSDSDEDFSPEKKSDNTKAKKTKKGTNHDLSDSESDMDTVPPPTRKRKSKVHEMSQSASDSESDDIGTPPAKKTKTAATPSPVKVADSGTPTKGKKLPKCKYWDACYRKDPTHLKDYMHPSDQKGSPTKKDTNCDGGAEPMDTDDASSPKKSKNHIDDGDSVDVKGGLGGKTDYRIKRTGDSYYCTCLGWKNQNKPVSARSCRHLKDYLGEEFENARCGDHGGGSKTITRSPKSKAIPQLLLAHKYTESTNANNGWWMSEKLDGVRAYWDGKAFYSRLGNEFIPPPSFVEGFPSDMELDGELFGGRGRFQSTVSIVKTPGSDKWKNLSYKVFDTLSHGHQPFEKRLAALKKHFEENDAPNIEVLAHEKCKGAEHIKTELKTVIAKGGEGLMIRQPGSKYVNGRSSTLLKIKTFHDAEAKVIGYDPGKGRNANVVGSLRCEMECGKKFSVGSGLNDAQRKSPPKKGSIITYKFQELTDSGVPRFPTFIGIRIDMDGPKDAVLPAKIKD